MAQETSISLVRHGLVANPDNVYYGRLAGFSISDEGREQAKAAAEALAAEDVVALYSSPMQRAQQTAAILGVVLGLEPRENELLHEIYSAYDGSPVAEMEARNWDGYTGTGPPYEQPIDILDRMRRFLDEMREQFPGQHTVGVTHADPIAFTILWALGEELVVSKRGTLDRHGFMDVYPAPASITTFRFHTGQPDEKPEVSYKRPYVKRKM